MIFPRTKFGLTGLQLSGLFFLTFLEKDATSAFLLVSEGLLKLTDSSLAVKSASYLYPSIHSCEFYGLEMGLVS